ncbi:uncharacterized protein [Coffea arabica]|uniref:Hexosyltransferase n=1 Tax=Coffea arabica TaxID=13443 RepID=A0ABM4VHK1_COFAR
MGRREREISFENRKLLWFIGLVLASVLLLQYFELPYGHVISNFFSAGKNYSHFTEKDRADGVANFSVALDKSSSYSMNQSASEKNGGSAASNKINDDRASEVELSLEDLYHNLTFSTRKRNNSVETEKGREYEYRFAATHVNTDMNSASGSIQVEDIALSDEMRKLNDSVVSGNVTLAQGMSEHQDDSGSARISVLSNTTALDKDAVLGQQQSQFALIGGISSKKAVPATKKTTKSTERTVMTIRELNYMFQSLTSSPPNSTILPSSDRDKQLLKARLELEKVETVKDKSGLYAPIYWNISRFERHHEASISWSKLYLHFLQPLPTLNIQVGIFAMITISNAIIRKGDHVLLNPDVKNI